MSRKRATIALTATLTVFSITSAMAGVGHTLGDCYNFVISACNETAHPVVCSEKAMTGCDKQFSAAIDPRHLNGLKTPTQNNPYGGLTIQF